MDREVRNMPTAGRNPFAKKAVKKTGATTAKKSTKSVGKKSNAHKGAAKLVKGAGRTGMKAGQHSRKGY
jgi:hypothetical protein